VDAWWTLLRELERFADSAGLSGAAADQFIHFAFLQAWRLGWVPAKLLCHFAVWARAELEDWLRHQHGGDGCDPRD
jgi:hypothetical protein